MPSRRRGFNLVELLLALVISAALLTATMVALNASFMAYQATTEVASTQLPREPSLRRRIGRLLRLPGVPRRPRWSEIWPSGEDADGNEEGA